MEPISDKKPAAYRYLKLVLKIGVTIACLWYVFSTINPGEVIGSLRKADWSWLLAAFLIYSLSKLIASVRLKIYFKNIGLTHPYWQNVKLYWLGMFYNLFLPGAITGDAYKVMLLSKKFSVSYKKTTAAVLLDRFSGLLSLGLIVAIFSFFVVKERWITILLITGAMAALPVLYFIIKKVFPSFLQSYWPTFLLGAVVQLSVLLCVYFILFALNINEGISSYIFIFLIAAIASVLPISVGGGLGIREFVIIEGAKYAGLGLQGQHNAFMLSMIFYIVTVVCSLGGIPFVFKNPLSNNRN